MKTHQLFVNRPGAILKILCLALHPIQASAQDCIDTIARTTQVSHYQINDNGTVENTPHNIMWMRCSLGQIWQNGHCRGNPHAMTWDEALTAAKASRFAEHSDWRLPTIHELSAITELRCQQPAINLSLFPDTSIGDYWSITEFVNNIDMAWLVHFSYGENHTAKKSTSASVRLVRSTHR
ncbi:Lcl C-terminal domain-containing protein [Kaarinaea lacus]